MITRSILFALACLTAHAAPPSLVAYLQVNAAAGFSVKRDDFLVTRWVENVGLAGGVVSTSDVVIARGLVEALNRTTYGGKIVVLMPMLGQNFAATRVALINRIAFSATATNNNFVDGDFSNATGLKGNGTNKILTLAMKPGNIGTGNNGGFGYWENDIDFGGSGVEVMGCYDSGGSNRYVLDLRTNRQQFIWGGPGNAAGPATTAVNGHYYGQRSSATLRELFLNGSSIGTNTTSDSAFGVSDRQIRLMGSDAGTVFYWKGRCAVAYLTDGTLTSGEVSALHTLLNAYLIAPTGR